MNEKNKYILLRAVRFSFAAAVYAFLIYGADLVLLFSFYGVGSFTRANALQGMNRSTYYEISRIVLCLLSYVGVFEAFVKSDRTAKEAYKQKKPYAYSLVYAVKSIGFWCSLTTTALLFAVCPDWLPIASVEAVLRLPSLYAYLLTAGAYAVALLLVWHLGIRAWRAQKKERIEILFLIGELLLIAISVGIIAFFIPPFMPILSGFFGLVATFGLPIVIIVVCVLLVCEALAYIRAVSVRASFLRKLKRLAKKNGYKVSVTRPYLSVFSNRGGTVTVQANGKAYVCKLLAGIHYRRPMYFGENGEGEIVHHISMRVRSVRPLVARAMIWQKVPDDVAQFRRRFRYDFKAEGKKIILVNPTPHIIYATGYGQNKLLDVGDTFHGYTLMTGTAFINALERNAI